jgi:type II restriction enzyme
MLLQGDLSAAERYKSPTQISRIISEKWLSENGYCLACRCDRLIPTKANTKASDFICSDCKQNYELKSFLKKPTNKLVDGAYYAMISRIQNGSVPILMLLERNYVWKIQSLTAIHHMFLTPEVIEKRKPLSPSARRAGWIGCNIRLDRIAQDAQIQIIHDSVQNTPISVRDSFQRFNRLQRITPQKRGWATLTLRAIRDINQDTFLLSDLYKSEVIFSRHYPNNNNVRAKIRQQLQVLRDLGYLEFCGKGLYKMLI